ncbi:MAG: AAA family ATPase [Alphaproteobacteria bacterium]|nr:AAA family ATPase [Alphaproteobacteria bacterium]
MNHAPTGAPAGVWAQWATHIAPPPGPLPLAAEPATYPAPETIPPREWLYGHRLIRRFVSVLAAPGGVGKSSLALAQALALATGRPFLGERVHHTVPCWVFNLEDPPEETQRRVAALMRFHAIAAEDVGHRLFLNNGRLRRLVMAEPDNGGGIALPDKEPMIAAAQAAGVGLIVVDPFVKSHRLDENSNMEMDAAATAWAEVADRTACAVLLVHHVRKGTADSVDATRGAKALTDAARSAALLSPMSPEDAQHLGIPERERWRYVRLDDAKANLAPRAHGALWFRLETVQLGNGNTLYPLGDQVAAIAAWVPPNPFKDLSPADCNKALDAIAAGQDGHAFTRHRGGRIGSRWAGTVLETLFGILPDEAARILAIWLRNGLLIETEYRHPDQRKPRLGLKVVDSKRPTTANPNPAGASQ